MRRRWLARALIVVGAAMAVVAGIGGAQAAFADGGISVQGSLPTTADPGAIATACDLTGGPYLDQDVWVFSAANGNHLDALTATFIDADGGVVDRKLTDTDQTLDLAGHSVAWLRTPAGWTLTAATASTAADAGGPLLIMGTCPAAPAKDSNLAAPNRAAEAPARPADAQVKTLPVTGHDVGGMLALGLGLVFAGGLLLTVRRRRPTPTATPAARDEAHVWTYPKG
jgi:LPXTG-motif cell wall-anchored protein